MDVTNDQIAELEKQLAQIKIEHWLREDLFSPQWWIMLVVFVVPWIIWWKYADRNRILPITILGLLTLILSSYMDSIGSELAVWQYNKMLIPLWSRLISVDFSIMPVTYMFIYQYFQGWRQYIVASVVMALLYAFCVEPLLVWFDIYKLNNWSLWYSFVIYIILAASVKWLAEIIAARNSAK